MKNVCKVFGMIALIAIIGFSLIACGNPAGGGGKQTPSPDTEEGVKAQLPAVSGTNELSGKTYELDDLKITFGADASYTVYDPKNDDPRQKGFYAWNAENDEVSLAVYQVSIDGQTFVTRSQFDAAFTAYITSNPEYISDPDAYLEDAGYETIAELVADMKSAYMPTGAAKYYYQIKSNNIVHFSRLKKTATTIGGCAYTESVESDGENSIHYNLSISYNEALSILTEELGTPKDGWNVHYTSSLTPQNATDVVILELGSNDVRLHSFDGSGNRTTKGWQI